MSLRITTPIPFHIEMRSLFDHGNDPYYYQIKFGVVGVDTPAAAVVCENDHGQYVVAWRTNLGSFELHLDDFDVLAVACFKLCLSQTIDLGGDSVAYTMSDATRLLTRVIPQRARDYLMIQLQKEAIQVDIGEEVRDVVVVADDNFI